MRLLITGVSGFVGNYTAVLALSAGHEVIAVGRKPLSDELIALGAREYVWGGWPTKFASSGLAEIIELYGHIDALIHIAGDAHYGNGEKYRDANVTPTELLVRAIKDISPKTRFVLASSVGAQDFPRFGSAKKHDETTKPVPRSDYGRSKLEAEKIVISSGIDYSIARLGMVIGRDMRLDSHVAVLLKSTSSTLLRKLISLFRGVLPLVHIDDVAEAILLLSAGNTPSGTYLVVTENLSIKSIVNIPRGEKNGPGFFGLSVFAGVLPAQLGTGMSPVMRFSSEKLRAIGWVPKKNTTEAVKEVYMRLQQKQSDINIVTGVASGLGHAIMKEIIQNNEQIIGIDRDSIAINKLKKQYPKQTFICADVTDPNLFEQVSEINTDINSSITSLYLVAGLGTKSKFIEQDPANVRLQFEVNVLARLNLAQKFLQNREMTGQSGRLFIVSSSTALQPLPDFAVYGATNAALLSFGRALIAETASELCQILVLIPGGMDTNFQQSAGVRRLEKERLLDPAHVAQQIIQSSSSRSRVKIIGRNARIFQLLSRFLPWRVADAIWARITKLTR